LSGSRAYGRAASMGVLAASLAATSAAAWRDARSPLSDALRSGLPFTGLVTLRAAERGASVPPAAYVVLHDPLRGTVDLIETPPQHPAGAEGSTLADVYGRAYLASGDPRKAGKTMAEAAAAALTRRRTWPPGAPTAPLYRVELDPAPAEALSGPEGLKRALLARTADPLFWLRLPALLRRRSGAAPELSAYDAWTLAREASALSPGGVRLARLSDAAGAAEFVARAVSPSAAEAPARTVEVLNSSGDLGVALKATKILRWRGVDVIHFGNSRGPESASTRFVDRTGRPEAAEAVRRALDCPDAEVLTEVESSPRASVSVILGRDYARCGALRQ